MVACDARPDGPRHWAQWAEVPRIWRTILAMDRSLVGLLGQLEITGSVSERLRQSPLLLTANHIGVFDAFVLMAACRQIGIAPRFLLTGGLLDAPVLGPALKASGHIRVDRGKENVADAFGRAVAALNSSAVPLLVYPEGRISRDVGLWPERGKTGAARMALASGAPVVPISQWGAHEAVYWGTETVHGWADVKPLLTSGVGSIARRPRFAVHFGDPVGLDDLTADRPGDAVRAHARIMRAITGGLRTLRQDEPDTPRFHDPTRPTDTRSPWHNTP
ncbi:MAG: lysophospholipid acyltransferase family protein [Sciscionella sp.]